MDLRILLRLIYLMQYPLSLGLVYISLLSTHLTLLLKHNILLPKSDGCIKLAMLIFGGILNKRCTWSGIICPSIISTLLYLQSVLMISCKSFRYCLYIIFLLYFGTITMWYLHNHFVCDKLFVLLAIKISFRCTLRLEHLIVLPWRIFLYNFWRAPA